MNRNKDNLNKWNREYYRKRKTNKTYADKRRASGRKYYHKNKDRINLRKKEYAKKNIVRYRQYRRDWKKFTPAGIFSTLKLSAKRRNVKLLISKEEFVFWWMSQIQECYYCKRTLEQILQVKDSVNRRAQRLTIERVDNDKPYALDNMRLACYRCNTIKNDYFTADEMLQIGQIINVKELARRTS